MHRRCRAHRRRHAARARVDARVERAGRRRHRGRRCLGRTGVDVLAAGTAAAGELVAQGARIDRNALGRTDLVHGDQRYRSRSCVCWTRHERVRRSFAAPYVGRTRPLQSEPACPWPTAPSASGTRAPTPDWLSTLERAGSTRCITDDERFGTDLRNGDRAARSAAARALRRRDRALGPSRRAGRSRTPSCCRGRWPSRSCTPRSASSSATGARPRRAGRTCPRGAATTSARAITLEQLLEMRDGLDFVEDYVDDRRRPTSSRCCSARAGPTSPASPTARPLAHPPGDGVQLLVRHQQHRRRASSATRSVAGRRRSSAFLRERLFDPIGMRIAPTPASTTPAPSSARRTSTRPRRTSPASAALPPRRRVGRHAAPARGLGRPRPAGPLDRPDRRPRARRALVGGRRRPRQLLGQRLRRPVDPLCAGLDLIVVRLGKTPDEPVDHLTHVARWVRDYIVPAERSEVLHRSCRSVVSSSVCLQS